MNDIYIYIYTDAPAVLLVHVGLAQARPNYTLRIIIDGISDMRAGSDAS